MECSKGSGGSLNQASRAFGIGEEYVESGPWLENVCCLSAFYLRSSRNNSRRCEQLKSLAIT